MPRPGRIFALLDVRYFDDDRILAAGADWQLHFAAVLACKGLLNDGKLTRRQLARIAPDSVGDITRSIDHLIEVGLFIDQGDSIVIHGWAEWNDSAADVEAMAKGGAYGNHLRWHVRQNLIKEGCSYCRDLSESGGESPGESGGESNIQTQRQSQRHKDPSVTTAVPFEAEFAEFWELYPRKVARPRALKAYLAIKDPHDEIMAGLKPWLDYWKIKNEPQYVPHPSTWLNECRWQDSPPPVSRGHARVLPSEPVLARIVPSDVEWEDLPDGSVRRKASSPTG